MHKIYISLDNYVVVVVVVDNCELLLFMVLCQCTTYMYPVRIPLLTAQLSGCNVDGTTSWSGYEVPQARGRRTSMSCRLGDCGRTVSACQGEMT